VCLDVIPRADGPVTSHSVLVSIVIPVYRNAATLAELHRRLVQVLSSAGLTFEVIFVEDDSPDGSLEILGEIADTDPRVAILSIERNVGQHRATMIGIARSQGGIVVTLDADLQDPPDAIPKLVATLRQGHGAVFAGRVGRYEAAHRQLTSRIFKLLLHLATGVPVDAGAFVAFDRRTADSLLKFQARTPFLPGLIGLSGARMISLPVKRSVRQSGRSAYSGWRRFRTGASALAWALLWKSVPPIRPLLQHGVSEPGVTGIHGRRASPEED